MIFVEKLWILQASCQNTPNLFILLNVLTNLSVPLTPVEPETDLLGFLRPSLSISCSNLWAESAGTREDWGYCQMFFYSCTMFFHVVKSASLVCNIFSCKSSWNSKVVLIFPQPACLCWLKHLTARWSVKVYSSILIRMLWCWNLRRSNKNKAQLNNSLFTICPPSFLQHFSSVWSVTDTLLHYIKLLDSVFIHLIFHYLNITSG